MSRTPEAINAALARWLGWYMDTAGWFYKGTDKLYNNDPGSTFHFNPMQRIDHAWVLVEKAPTLLNQHDWGFFMYWFMHADLYSFTAERAANDISEKIAELAGIEV